MRKQHKEPNIETRLAILEQERELWANTRYQWEIRHRVYTRIGASEGEIKEALANLERCEKAMDALAEEIESLEHRAAPRENN